MSLERDFTSVSHKFLVSSTSLAASVWFAADFCNMHSATVHADGQTTRIKWHTNNINMQRCPTWSRCLNSMEYIVKFMVTAFLLSGEIINFLPDV